MNVVKWLVMFAKYKINWWSGKSKRINSKMSFDQMPYFRNVIFRQIRVWIVFISIKYVFNGKHFIFYSYKSSKITRKVLDRLTVADSGQLYVVWNEIIWWYMLNIYFNKYLFMSNKIQNEYWILWKYFIGYVPINLA